MHEISLLIMYDDLGGYTQPDLLYIVVSGSEVSRKLTLKCTPVHSQIKQSKNFTLDFFLHLYRVFGKSCRTCRGQSEITENIENSKNAEITPLLS